jgi:hypothetical protein
MTRGYDKPLYVQPFDHRGSFEMGMFGWKGEAVTAPMDRLRASIKQFEKQAETV